MHNLIEHNLFAPQSTSEIAVKFKVKSEGQTPSSIFQEINTFKFNFHTFKMNFYTTMYFNTFDMFFYSFKEHLLLTFIKNRSRGVRQMNIW